MLIKYNKWPLGIRNRILLFTLLVTLIPSLGLGWIFYSQTQQLLWEKVELELKNTITQVNQEIELWVKKSSINLSVFSNSFILTENLELFLNSDIKTDSTSSKSKETLDSLKKITNYLQLIQDEFDEYQRFTLLDNQGTVITESNVFENELKLPNTNNWKAQLETNNIIITETKFGSSFNDIYLTIIVPVLSDKNIQIGLLATDLKINGIKSIFNTYPIPKYSDLLLLNTKGFKLFSTSDKQVHNTTPHIEPKTLQILLENQLKYSIYNNANHVKMIGVAKLPNNFPWFIVIEKNHEQTFSEITSLKKQMLIILALLITIFGAIAYLVSQSILCPLKQLVTGANQVTAGDLDVKLPISKNDELGFAISVFNDMVQQLKQNHDEREKMLRTDSLTGLFNRKHMSEILNLQIERFRRNQIPFSLCIADIDYFKKINDNYGHPVGDIVLTRAGKIFREILRTIDFAGRYGGEEFIIILDETEEQQAIHTANRIRKAFEECEIFTEGIQIKFTISIGIATIFNLKETEDSFISRADKALYEAKSQGRNRVVHTG